MILRSTLLLALVACRWNFDPIGEGNGDGGGDGGPRLDGSEFTSLTQRAYIKASNTDGGDEFGFDVGLSADGTTLAIGALREASNAVGVDGDQSNNSLTFPGAAYVFVRSGEQWAQQAYIKATNTDALDEFGFRVALSADGNRLAVSARLESSAVTGVGGNQADNNAAYAGAVYTYVRSGTSWSPEAYLKASNTEAQDQFGFSIALSADGRTLAVAAPIEASNATGIDGDQSNNSLQQSGAVYVFTLGATWAQQAYIKASNPGLLAQFGTDLAISADGNTLVVGASEAGGTGAAYVFTRAATTWSQAALLSSSNLETGDELGFRVAMAGDGNTVVVAARSEDSAATTIDGTQADNSAMDSGAGYVFVRGATWTQQAYLKVSNTGAGDNLGTAATLSHDGSTLVLCGYSEDGSSRGVNGADDNGVSDSGACYAFRRTGTAWSQHSYIKASNGDVFDLFGQSCEVSADASTVAIGAYFEDSAARGIDGDQSSNAAQASGAVYVFR